MSLLTVNDLSVSFVTRNGTTEAVKNVSFNVESKSITAIIGESGSGKSVSCYALLGLIPQPPGRVDSGTAEFGGRDLLSLSERELRGIRGSDIAMIFQDPISSLNPRRKVRDIVLEPLNIWNRGTKAEQLAAVDKILEHVGIDPQRAAESQPHQFSGGQCQRISIARALTLEPKVLICDEPVSSLAVSIQAQILNILQEMKVRYGLSLIFISHDLAVVRAISTRILVMYLGKVCEIADPDTLCDSPRHHYTHALVSSVPVPDPTVHRHSAILQGEPPSPTNPPSGCRFRTRCAAATELCATEEPQLRETTPGNYVACHHPRD